MFYLAIVQKRFSVRVGLNDVHLAFSPSSE